MDDDPEVTVYGTELILAYAAVGLFVLAILLRFVWQREGLMVEAFDWERWRLFGVAAVFGFGLGWLLFPRRLPMPRFD